MRLNDALFSDSQTPLHYNPEVRPGTENWHKKVSVPGSAGRLFKWPTYNQRIYKPGIFLLTASISGPSTLILTIKMCRYVGCSYDWVVNYC